MAQWAVVVVVLVVAARVADVVRAAVADVVRAAAKARLNPITTKRTLRSLASPA